MTDALFVTAITLAMGVVSWWIFGKWVDLPFWEGVVQATIGVALMGLFHDLLRFAERKAKKRWED